MPAKLILIMDGAVLKEYALSKERMTIGRKPHNDIVIDNLAVSSEHAAIVTILNDSFLEDLDSTNGLAVNGTPTKKHFLQNNDVIEVGKYKLKYLNDQPTQTTAADFEKTMVLRGPVKTAPFAKTEDTLTQLKTQVNVSKMSDTTGNISNSGTGTGEVKAATQTAQATVAIVQILSGPNAGKELELTKSLTTLGKPGVQVAVLARRPHGFFITHVEGITHPLVNGKPVGENPHQLNDNDIIELAGIKMEFYLKS
jgi:pSer/pThr/pTyr-binding forkhead associated (FHA) protein